MGTSDILNILQRESIYVLYVNGIAPVKGKLMKCIATLDFIYIVLNVITEIPSFSFMISLYYI